MTADPETLRQLLARVEGAAGADRHADVLLWALHRGLPLEWQGSTLVAGEEGVIGWRDPGEHSDNFYTNRAAVGPGSIPPYTASVDAALALVGRIYPGAEIMVRRGASGKWTALVGGSATATTLPTPALALLAALLRAKIAETDNG